MVFPESPGLWRRIELHPRDDLVIAGLEDDFHRFTLALEHDGAVATGLDARVERAPWSTCPAAADFLAVETVGKQLDAVAALDPFIHCTHLFDLVVLAARHVADEQPTRYDIWVSDSASSCRTVVLQRNGQEKLRWIIKGTQIIEPQDWAGWDLRRLSHWKGELGQDDAEHAMLMRRAVYISGGRKHEPDLRRRAADNGLARLGACFTYQMPRAKEASHRSDWHTDFSRSNRSPLIGFPVNEG